MIVAERPSAPDADDEGTPRWVKVVGAVLVVLLVIFVLQHLLGGGLGNHLP